MQRVTRIPQLKPRQADSHKGTYGRVLVIAGSRRFPGAAILAARAALRAGAGLVEAVVPEAVATPLAAACPECIHQQAGDPAGVDLSACTAAAIGPGLDQDARAGALVEKALAAATVPLVIDADALNLLARMPRGLAGAAPHWILTPHPGEFERLCGERPRGDAARLAAAEQFTARHAGVLVLKGSHTIVAGGNRAYINDTGNPGMATAGSGDVLAGIIAGLAAQGLAPFDAAVLGVYLHGLAGDLARDALGEMSLVASDITDHLAAAIRQERPTV